MLTNEEKEIIKTFASGLENVRERARAIYNKYVNPKYPENVGGNRPLELEFLSECFSPVPDLRYRAMLRKQILDGSLYENISQS